MQCRNTWVTPQASVSQATIVIDVHVESACESHQNHVPHARIHSILLVPVQTARGPISAFRFNKAHYRRPELTSKVFVGTATVLSLKPCKKMIPYSTPTEQHVRADGAARTNDLLLLPAILLAHASKLDRKPTHDFANLSLQLLTGRWRWRLLWRWWY